MQGHQYDCVGIINVIIYDYKQLCLLHMHFYMINGLIRRGRGGSVLNIMHTQAL